MRRLGFNSQPRLQNRKVGMFFIGDVHGKIMLYLDKVKRIQGRTLQVGDMGLGFVGTTLPLLSPNHRFIRGNHDSPIACREHPNYMGDFGYSAQDDLFYLGGAWSIDWARRKEGRSWWRDEELSIVDLNMAQQLYLLHKPRVVVTHDCPERVALEMLKGVLMVGGSTNLQPTRTQQALEQMFALHQPEHWLFGHWHVDKEIKIGNTTFHCLNELSMKEIPTSPRSSIR